MSRVFVTQTPTVRLVEGVPTPYFDITPAAEFGELVIMANRGDLDLEDSGPLVWKLRDFLRDFTRMDYLLPIGHPATMAVATCLAAEQTGGEVKLLVWNRELKQYEVYLVDLNAQPQEN